MKVTIDSNESLTDALRVLGAMYDVTVTVAEHETAASTPVDRDPAPAAAPRRVRGRKPKKSPAGKAKASVTNLEIRSWALENGMTVSNRGRLPAQVVAAYRDAHHF